MEWLKNWTAQIQAQLVELSVSQKLLIGTLAVVIAASLFLVALYAGQPQMVPLIDSAANESQRAAIVSYLDSRGVKYESRGDRILVPASQRSSIAAALHTGASLPDQQAGFALLIEQQTWWQSNEQYRQMYTIALQNELSQTIGRMRQVERAKVIISHPKVTGFAATHRRPTASVNVEMTDGSLNQNTANAIAALVSGAVAEMNAEDVAVIDAIAGRQFRARDGQQMIPSDFLELVQHQERLYRGKLTEALSYIPSVIVAVNVELQTTRRQRDSTTYDKDNSATLMTREHSRSESSTERRSGGEPGVRANTGVDITGTEGGGRETTLEEIETEFDPYAGVEHVQEFEPGGVPTRISATVNVPRSYFVGIYMRGKAEDAAEPDDAALQAIYDEHLQRIQRQVEPLLTSKSAGQLVVDVYPDAGAPVAAAGMGSAAGGGLLAMLSGKLTNVIVPGALAVVAVFTLLLIARKAGQTTPVPSAEELAGLPASLDASGEPAGEAGEADSALPGMELDEEQLASRQVAQQVAQMVKANPEEAAGLLRQWVKQEE